MEMFIGTGLLPLPPEYGAVLAPYARVVPHSNQPVAGAPFGFTMPLSVADDVLTEVAGFVLMVGRVTAGAGVSQVKGDP